MKILISGVSGLIGKKLVKKLTDKGHSVNILTRKKSGKPNEFQWNTDQNYIEDAAFDGVESIIHLAGATIAKKWTERYKKELYSSRINGAKLMLNYCNKHQIKLKNFISASGINYYGTFTNNEFLTEEMPQKQQDFLANLSKDWENAAQEFSKISERIVCIRTAMVLAKEGGSFSILKKITDFNISSAVGTGQQWMNWIHIDDLIKMYIFAVENTKISGNYNAVADDIPTNKGFMKTLAKESNKFFLPINIPTFILKIILGEMSGIILEGTRASNQKIKSQGFNFQFSNLKNAFGNLIK